MRLAADLLTVLLDPVFGRPQPQLFGEIVWPKELTPAREVSRSERDMTRPNYSSLLATLILSLLVNLLTVGLATGQEVWIGGQTKVNITDGDYYLPQDLRWSTEARFGDEGIGLRYLLLRVGPQWTFNEHFQLALSTTAISEEGDEGEFQPQLRAELEPHVLWTLGPAKFDDRSRLESRWFSSGQNWRYRNQLNISLDLGATPWVPFASEELFIDFDAGRVSESRSKMGVAWQSGGESGLSLSFAYLLRFTRDAPTDWAAQHIAVIEASFGPSHPHIWEFDGL